MILFTGAGVCRGRLCLGGSLSRWSLCPGGLHYNFSFFNFWFPRTKFQSLKSSIVDELRFSPKSVFTPVCDSVHGGGGLSGSSLFRGVTVQVESLSRGVPVGGSLSRGVVSVQGWSLSGRPPCTVMCGQYASYWMHSCLMLIANLKILTIEKYNMAI